MKVGLITGEYPPMQGGVGDFTFELAQALAALGHETHIITTNPLRFATRADDKRRLTNAPLQYATRNTQYVHHCVKSWNWQCWKTIQDVTHTEKLDVLNVQYQAAAYQMHPAINFLPAARRWLNLPIVTTFHDLNVPYLFPKAGPLRQWTVLELARRSDGIIVTNYEDEANLTSNLQPPTSNITRIPIGSNIKPALPEGYARTEWRARWGAQPGDMLISYFGFLHPLKGGEALIRALAQLAQEGRAVRVLFIGGTTGSSDTDTNAAFAARVQALANELGVADRLAFTGYVPPQDVTAAFYASDVTALPYLEGASLRHGTLMAALAHGRAIVTTRSSRPAPELRDGENVLLVPPGNVAALTKEIKRVMDSPDLRARLEHGAAELAKQFTWDSIAQSTANVYQRVIQTLNSNP